MNKIHFMQFFMQFPLIHNNIPVYYVIQQHNNILGYYVIQHAQQQGYHYVWYMVDSVVGIKAVTLYGHCVYMVASVVICVVALCRQRVDNV